MAPCCDCNRNCFELIRTDVYAYINLTGIAYCNAARNCEHLIEANRLFVGGQSVMYFYRICSYVFTIGITLIASYFLQLSKLNGIISYPSLIFVFILSYSILVYFVDIHANLAEGIQVSYLIELSLSNGNVKGRVGSDGS